MERTDDAVWELRRAEWTAWLERRGRTLIHELVQRLERQPAPAAPPHSVAIAGGPFAWFAAPTPREARRAAWRGWLDQLLDPEEGCHACTPEHAERMLTTGEAEACVGTVVLSGDPEAVLALLEELQAIHHDERAVYRARLAPES